MSLHTQKMELQKINRANNVKAGNKQSEPNNRLIAMKQYNDQVKRKIISNQNSQWNIYSTLWASVRTLKEKELNVRTRNA